MPGSLTHPCPSTIAIVEVGPREGLPGEVRRLPAAAEIELIDRLMAVERNIYGCLGHASRSRLARAVSRPRSGHAPR